MILLHRIGSRVNSNFNELEEILAHEGPISFDGVYTSVWGHRESLKGKDIKLFFCGGHVGRDNTFDTGQPYGQFCDWNQLLSLKLDYGFKLGYHSLTHRNLVDLTDQEIVEEVAPPFPMASFCYPYGNVDARVEKAVREAGYSDAWSVIQGDGSQYQRHRRYLNW